MAFKGKLIGALLGSIAGPMGTILGGVIGHLFDRATEERRATEGFSIPYRTDAVSAAQVNFLTSLIGLSIAVANADRHVRTSQVDALRSFFRQSFPYSEADQRVIQRIIDETFRRRNQLDVPGLCGYYRATSTPAGRLLLLRLLFKVADADGLGVSGEEERVIRAIAEQLGIDAYGWRSIQVEFTHEESRAYQILGLAHGASEEEVRSAYRRLAAQYHPDTVANLGDEFVKVAEEKFKLINQAYEEIRHERGF